MVPVPQTVPGCLPSSTEGLWAESQGKMRPLQIPASLHHNEIFFMKSYGKGPTQVHKTGVCVVNIIITRLCIHKIHKKTGINSIIVVRRNDSTEQLENFFIMVFHLYHSAFNKVIMFLCTQRNSEGEGEASEDKQEFRCICS